MVILMEATKYEADHDNSKFVRPSLPPLYNRDIANNATTVVRVCTKATHKSCLNNYASYKAAEYSVAKYLRDIVDKIWYNNWKDAKTFYTKVTALKIMAHLNAKSGGLHAIDMISLHSNMMQYYMQVDGIPQFIVMMVDLQKKAKQAGMPIANVECMMMALAAILAAQHFLQEVDDWEGLPAINRTEGRLLSGPPQMPASTSGIWGGVGRWVVPMLFSPPLPQPLTTLGQLLTT